MRWLKTPRIGFDMIEQIGLSVSRWGIRGVEDLGGKTPFTRG